MSESTDLLKPGDNFGEYKVVKLLGRGGMGAVYLVRHLSGTLLAAKIMYPDQVKAHPEFVERFLREGEFAMKIRHPNLIAVYDIGQDPDTGYYYLLMDYVPGGDVRQRLDAHGAMPIAEAVHIVEQVASAVTPGSSRKTR